MVREGGLIQILVEGWTFSLNSKELVISGYGITKVRKHNNMAADTFHGFALGWAACHADSIQETYGVTQMSGTANQDW